MAKFSGNVGFVYTLNTSPGVYKSTVTEQHYHGDVLRNTRQLVTGENINDDVKLNNRISIVADPYAVINYFAIKYVVWMGAKWKVTDVEIQRPRLILTLGEMYNGPEDQSTGDS